MKSNMLLHVYLKHQTHERNQQICSWNMITHSKHDNKSEEIFEQSNRQMCWIDQNQVYKIYDEWN
jgi:6-phosphogluconolactonase (cycloisomerase 2 family)